MEQNTIVVNQRVEEWNRLGLIRWGWILLDNQSTVNILCDHTLLNNIRKLRVRRNIHCNAVIASTNWVGYLEGFGTLYYHKEGIVNILSLAKVQEKYHITYNIQDGNAFLVVKPDGQTHSFIMSDRGLYYLDTTAENGANLNTVAAKRSKYSAHDSSCGVNARQLQDIIGYPGINQFLEILDGGIPDCPVRREDALVEEDYFGGNLCSLKGKRCARN